MSDMAVKYGMLKRAKKMAQGGDMCAHGKYMCHECHGGEYAKGGSVPGQYEPEDDRIERETREHTGIYKNAKDREKNLEKDLKARWEKQREKDRERKIRELPEKYAEGGFVEEEEHSGYLSMPMEHEKEDHAAMMEDDRMLNQHGAEEVGAMDMEEDNEPQHERMVSHPVENQDDHEDMVGRIMRQRTHHYSRGGQVANDTPVTADFEDNQFDDLVKRDDLEQHYTGANSGDEIGDGQEDEDRHDIVSRIMRSRRKRDHLPHPA